MGGDRRREIWPCLYDVGQNFDLARIFARTSRGEI